MLTNLALRALCALRAIEDRFRDEDGQTLAEYGLIMSVIAVMVVVAGAIAFRGSIAGAFNTAGTCLHNAAVSSGC